MKILEKLNKYRVIPNENSYSDCFGWSGAVRINRTPRINIDGKTLCAHRAAWMVEYGKIPDHHYVRHKCNNYHCTNPKHLFVSRFSGSRKPEAERKSYRVGRSRLSVDLPTELVNQIKNMADRYHLTITRYLLKRLTEVIMYEKIQDNNRSQTL